MQFGVPDLIRTFGQPIVRQAQIRLDRGDVHVMPVEPGATHVFGIVRGSDNRPLKVSVHFEPRRSGAVEVLGFCGCPTRGRCEHMAAVLLGALRRHAPEEPWAPPGVTSDASPEADATRLHAPPSSATTAGALAVHRWLDGVERTLAGTAVRPGRDGEAKHRLLYLLDVDRWRLLSVLPTLAYLRKDGRLGATSTCGYTGGADRPAYVGAADREVIAAIVGHGHRPWTTGTFHLPVAIDPAATPRLLELLIETGRCHWRTKDAAPLARGPSRPGRIEWIVGPDGSQRSKLVVEDTADAVAVASDPSWYVDPGGGLAGPLQLEFPSALLRELLDAPVLTPELAEVARERLRRITPAPVPSPARLTVRERRVAPVSHLRLHVWRPEGWDALEPGAMPMAALSFDYAGARVFPDDGRTFVQRVSDGEILRMPRDREAERLAMERLESLGFVRDFDDDPDGPSGTFVPAPLDEDGREEESSDLDAFLIEFGRVAVPRLREQGWIVESDADYPYHAVEDDPAWFADVTEGPNEWFDLELGVEIDGQRLSLLPILVGMLRDPEIVERVSGPEEACSGERVALRLGAGRIVVLPMARVRSILATLTELFGDNPLAQDGAVTLSRWNAPRLLELEEALGEGKLRWSGGQPLHDLARKLRGFTRLAAVVPPPGFRGTLRSYQQGGLDWLQFLREHDLGGILADDMGLGKTVQVLAHLQVEKTAGRADRPSLVVAPTSVVANWSREAARFAPGLRTLVLHGHDRKDRFEQIDRHDLIVTTYPLLSRDEDVLCERRYHLLVLDEAQFIKNAKTKAAAIARRIDARHRLCLTGTPMENHLGELWALFDLLLPGLLGDARSFRKLFRGPIEKQGDRSRREALAARIRPFMLRRTKDQVATDLPPKTEMTRTIELERAQRDLYESIRLAMHEKVRREVARKGLERSTIVILDALLKLRQVCCDPRLLKLEQARRVNVSAKLEALLEMLEPMVEEGRRILLFSQFTSMLDLIEDELERRQIRRVRISGETRDRVTPVRRFQAGEVPLFLISLKAGGTGLNLTAADTVIHYDPWWNPAVEDQATDRAHRIGQDKPVFVYRLIVAGSVEEKMLALQAKKRDLAQGIYGERGPGAGPPLSAEDLEALFLPLD